MPRDRLKTPHVDALVAAFGSLETPAEVYAFLQDVCTVREIQEMAQRLAVARLLSQGAHYSDISEATGASATTIARVNRSLNYGADGYKKVLDRLDSEEV